jgi:hypothetical protein
MPSQQRGELARLGGGRVDLGEDLPLERGAVRAALRLGRDLGRSDVGLLRDHVHETVS